LNSGGGGGGGPGIIAFRLPLPGADGAPGIFYGTAFGAWTSFGFAPAPINAFSVGARYF